MYAGAPDWTGAKNLSWTTVYSIAFKFDALAALKELQIRKSLDLPTTLESDLSSRLNQKLQPNIL